MHSGSDETAKAEEAESVVAGSTKTTSKRTEKLDKIEDRIIEPTESGYYSTATDFYVQNEDGIKSAASDVAKGINLSAIQDDIRGFAESSRVLMSLLDEVAKLHPVVAVAVLAFKAVVTLELKRRDNDKKVIALHLQMQDMMSTLLQLRDIQQDRKGTDGRTVRDRLNTLMNDIAGDIRNCGNVCDTYSKKHLLVKILKGPIYEGRLSDCATTFTDRQKDIRMALIIHTAVKISSVSTAVADVHETVESTSEAVDTILLFRMLDSSDERELLKRVQENGGAKACMENDDILLELSKLREVLRKRQLGRQCNAAPGELGGSRTRRSRRTRAGLGYATGYPIVGRGGANYMTSAWPPPVTRLHPTYAPPPQYAHDTAWNPGHTRPTPANGPYVGMSGERQPNEYDPVPVYPGGYDSTPLGQRLAEDILNPLKTELNQDVDEGLKKNMVVFRRQLDVQTRQLEDIVIREGDRVIAAVTSGPHERILDPDLRTIWKEMDWKRSVNSREFVFALHEYFTEKYSSSDPLQAYISSTVPKSAKEFRVAKQLANKKADNTRMLEYISMRHMQPILEAFDDDGSGFVSIREVNQLSSTRPANWSLPQCLSYWAVGWHYNTWDYKTKICGIIQTIYQERDNLLPVNRALVDVYLAHPTLDDLTTLMWSLQPFDTAIDDQFRQRATAYAQQEESRIERNLVLMAYEIDAASTLSLVTGPGRIERHLFPLLFLVMRHHLKIIRLAARVILNKEELITAVNTITQVLDYVQERATDLEAIFDQQNTFGASIHPQFNRFAFRMFLHLGEPGPRNVPLDDAALAGVYRSDVTNDLLDNSILKYPCLSGPDVAAYDTPELSLDNRSPSSIDIGGVWSGVCSVDAGNTACGLMEILFTSEKQSSELRGIGFDAAGTFEIVGSYLPDHSFQFAMVRKGTTDSAVIIPKYCSANQDPISHAFVGEWCVEREVRLGSLTMHPVPARLYKYLPPTSLDSCTIPRARWLWAMAEVTRELRPWHYCKQYVAARKRYTELYRRYYLSDIMEDIDMEELRHYECSFSSSDIRFWRSIACTHYSECIHLGVSCMSCRQRIVGPRYTYGSGGFCSNCVKANIGSGVIKCPRVVQEREMPSLMTAIGEIAVPGDTAQCSSCQQDTRRGYWVCVQCKKDVSMHCETCDFDLQLNPHDESHPLVYKAKYWIPEFPRSIASPEPQKVGGFFKRVLLRRKPEYERRSPLPVPLPIGHPQSRVQKVVGFFNRVLVSLHIRRVPSNTFRQYYGDHPRGR